MPEATHDLDAVLAQAARWKDAGHGVALATVVRTWGSSPRAVGSKLAVNDRGEFVGSVSGGCIEAAVIGEAQEVIAGAAPRVLSFGVSDERAWEVGLACGGRVDVYVEAVKRETLDRLRAVRAEHRAVALATPLDGGDAWLGDLSDAPAPLREAVGRALRSGAAEVAEIDGRSFLIEPHLPPLRLIVVGAVHVAETLAQMASLAGFAVTIVDPRRAWATEARFPGLALVTTWPDVALSELRPDARTAVVTLTHDPKLDDPALVAALASPAFYIGCLGSQKTHAARRDRLAGKGDLARLHGPVGLRIGARAPAEIAVSILAEIIATLRSAS